VSNQCDQLPVASFLSICYFTPVSGLLIYSDYLM
jgi:hypothetical protein